MHIEVDSSERYPFMWVRFANEVNEADEWWHPFTPNVELTDAEAADLRRVRDEFEAWQERLNRAWADAQPGWEGES